MLVLILLVGGCSGMRSAQPKAWDSYPDSGPLQVYGADLTSPGQQIFQGLLREPSVEALLSREGVPDTLEVVGSRQKPKQIVLSYTRKAAGKPHRIVLDSGEDGFVARASEPIAAPKAASKRGRSAKPPRKNVEEPGIARAKEPAKASTPTAQQRLECPIDATRADCRALCRGGASYEWCR
jgi:hypothetical protein